MQVESDNKAGPAARKSVSEMIGKTKELVTHRSGLNSRKRYWLK